MPRTFLVIILAALAAAAWAQTSRTVTLTLAEAKKRALQNHPQVLAAEDEAFAMGQAVAQERAAYFPNLTGDLTGSGANQQGRIGAGQLTTSRLFNRFANGVTVSQLVTDSGRTPNLVAAARLRAGAAQQSFQETRYDILLRVVQAYFNVLRAEQTIRVAQQTVAARQTIVEHVTALAQNKLRSDLDVSFADLSLAQARLLLIQAQNEQQEAFAGLTRALGAQAPAIYQLTDEPLPPGPPPDAEPLVTEAFANRPRLAALRLERDAAYRYERAERDLSLPSVSLVGVAGYIPFIEQITSPRVIPNEYGGAAVNVAIPVFNGHLYRARREEARYRALEASQQLRDEEQAVARDVRTAWAATSTAYQRMDVTAHMLRSATLAQQLAQGRYDLGLASIVELTQAQLYVTEADIQNLNAQYDYQSQYALLQYTLGALR